MQKRLKIFKNRGINIHARGCVWLFKILQQSAGMSANMLFFNNSATHFYHFTYALNGESNGTWNTKGWGRHPTVYYTNSTIGELPFSEHSRQTTSIYTAYAFSLQSSIRVAAVMHSPSHFSLLLLSYLIHLTWPSCETNSWADIKFTLPAKQSKSWSRTVGEYQRPSYSGRKMCPGHQSSSIFMLETQNTTQSTNSINKKTTMLHIPA